MNVTVNPAMTVALLLLGDVQAEREVGLLAGVGIDVAQDGVAVFVGVPVGTDAFVEEHVRGVVKYKGANCLAPYVDVRT